MSNLTADIIFLQETHSDLKNCKLWEQENRCKWVCSHGTTNSRGVAIVFNSNFKNKIKITQTITDDNGRLVICKIEYEEKMFTLCNIYGPNVDNTTLMNQLHEELIASDSENLIVGGDFNFVLDDSHDAKNRMPSHPQSKDKLNQIIDDLELSDAWRISHPDTFGYTWHRLTPNAIFSRLDWFMVNVGLQSCIRECEIIRCSLTDHDAVIMKIDIENFTRGPGIWKFNSLLLNDKQFTNTMEHNLKRAIADSAQLDIFEKWEMIKSEARTVSQNYAKQKKKIEHCNETNLKKSVNILRTELVHAIDKEQIINAINSIEAELDQYSMQRVNSSIFRSKVRFAKDGEKNSKYFFGLEKRNYFNKNMRAVKDQNGHLITDQSKILKEQCNFYKVLYTSNKQVVFNLHPEESETLVQCADRQKLEEPITLDEMRTAINLMKKGKAPGIDGLNQEFYCYFFDTLSPVLLEVYKAALSRGMLNDSARMGLISLIPKKSSNLLELKFWRPLVLLNMDYKCLSKIMAERIKPILDYLICPEQTGFMRGRHISKNIRRTFEIIRYCKKTKQPGLIMSLDFSKCFDKIEHSAIRGSMKYFNFGPIFTNWTMLFFTGLKVCTQNFGFISPWLNKERGSNQGCCYSPFAYLLCGEILARKLKLNNKIKGIDMNNGQIKNLISQFADDTALFMSYDKVTLTEVVDTLTCIENNIGLTINYDKTLIYRIGSLANSNAKMFTQKAIRWTNDPFELLGVQVSNNETDLNNYKPNVEKMNNVLNTWYNRNLTLMGKTLVINTLCESLFVYKLSVTVDVDEEVKKSINKAIDEYLWKGKRARIAKNTLQASKSKGGVRLFDIERKQMALKINWIPKICNDVFFNYCFFDATGLPELPYIFECNLSVKDCAKMLKGINFWSQTILHWCKFHYFQPKDLETILDQVIWLNSNVKNTKGLLLERKLSNKNIVRIKDIYDKSSPNGLMPFVKAARLYDLKCTWLEYQAVISCFPPTWKSWLKGTNSEIVTNQHTRKFSILYTNPKPSRYVYHELIEDESIIDKYGNRWLEDHQVDVDYITYKKAFKKLYYTTKITKFRDFQYRMLLNKLVFNIDLFKWRKRNDDICTFCKTHSEDLFHSLLYCKYSKRIWKALNDIIQIDITETDLSSFICNSSSSEDVINFIVIIIKQYLYRNRCQGKLPNITGAKREITTNYYIENSIAKKENNTKKFEKRWKVININNLFK